MTATDTHRFHPDGLTCALQSVDEGGHDARTGHAERVTKSDGAAMHVELVVIDTQVFGRRNHLRGKRFVDFHQIDVVDGHASTLHRLTARFDRAKTHDLGVQTRHAR